MAKSNKRRDQARRAKQARRARMPDGDGKGQSRYAKKRRGAIVPDIVFRPMCGECYLDPCRCAAETGQGSAEAFGG